MKKIFSYKSTNLNIIYGVGVFIIFGILMSYYTSGIEGWEKYFKTATSWLNIAISFITGVLFVVVLECLRKMDNLKDFISSEVSKHGEKIGRVIEYFALSTGRDGEEGNLEKVLHKMRKERGSVKWVIAKFITEKMHRDFDTKEGNIQIPEVNSSDFINFVKRIISECDKSLLWTCPWTPEKWFQGIFSQEEYDRLEREFWVPDLDNVPALRLFKLFKNASVGEKCRIINWTQDKKADVIKEATDKDDYKKKKHILEQFIRLNKEICESNLYFVYIEDCFLPNMIKPCYKEDYGIYDNKAVILYSQKDAILSLDLMNIASYRGLFTAIFDDPHRHGIYSPEKIMQNFESKNRKWNST